MKEKPGNIIQGRKADHIRINLREDVSSKISAGFENFYFDHHALPELNLKDINLKQHLFGKELRVPLLISSMTGGTDLARVINQRLAEIAQIYGLAMGVGSQRAAIENPGLADTFQVRNIAPDILLFANLGAVQLNYGYSLKECRQAIEMIDADGLILHLNPLQEALQPEGDPDFSSLLKKIDEVCRSLYVPVIVKEVGWGISEKTARQLISAGVSAIDVAGAGGTSWAKVEMHRAPDNIHVDVAKSFFDWGIPTTDSIINVQKVKPDFLTFASGGIQNGVEVCKSIALGASVAGLAGNFLRAVQDDIEQAATLCEQLTKEIQICMFAAGAENISSLKKTTLIRKDG